MLRVEWSSRKTCPPKFVAGILGALREQMREHGKVRSVDEITGPVPDLGGGF